MNRMIKTLGSVLDRNTEVIAVYVHGSRVKGNAVSNSDTDVAVLVDDRSKLDLDQELDLARVVKDALKFKHLDIRIVDQQTPKVFLFNVLRYGRVIYEKSQMQRLEHETKILRSFYDQAHIRSLYDKYLFRQIHEGTYGAR